MNHTKQPTPPTVEAISGIGMSPDDMSMLNQVLQQVKGISCVSQPVVYDEVVAE